VEAAWCITNIACGEPRHIAYLINLKVIDILVDLISTSTTKSVAEQAMWALCNISGDEYACLYMLKVIPYILTPILQLVGITALPLQSAIYPEAEEAILGTSFDLSPGPEIANFTTAAQADSYRSSDLELVRHTENFQDFPTLSIMRHVIFMIGNILRLKVAPFLRKPVYRIAAFVLADLIQSPDEDIVLDICNSVLCMVQLENIVFYNQGPLEAWSRNSSDRNLNQTVIVREFSLIEIV
jgi:hypothetical protein